MDKDKIKARMDATGFSEEEIVIIEWLSKRAGDELESGNMKLVEIFEQEMKEVIKKAKEKEKVVDINKIKEKAANTNFSLEEAILFDWLGQKETEELEKGNIELSDILLDEQFNLRKSSKRK